MPARNPEAVRQRAIAAGRHRSGQSAPPATPPLDPVFVALNRGQLPSPRGTQPEQGVRLRRAEEIETLSYRTVVALNQESRLAPRWRIATIARRAERAKRLAGDRAGRAERRHAERAARTGRSSRAHHQPEERGTLTDARYRGSSNGVTTTPWRSPCGARDQLWSGLSPRSARLCSPTWRPRFASRVPGVLPARGGVRVRRLADRPAEVIRLPPDGSPTVDCR
jgi:hypothetical protein